MIEETSIYTSRDYARIEKAIHFLNSNVNKPPSLQEIADHVQLSPFHFQRLFTDWAGITPKQFIQYSRLEFAKKLLKESEATLFETAYETGLSGTGRLHDLFVRLERMTPGEYKNGGENLTIQYSFEESLFGTILIASTVKGISSISFIDNQTKGLTELFSHYPNASWENKSNEFHQNVLSIFQNKKENLKEIKLHIQASEFQMKVWEALLKIPQGNLCTYGKIASYIQNPNASRAVGTAIGHNPVAFIIPCHRVIQSNGMFGGYMWGTDRKTAIIAWEAGNTNLLEHS